MPAFHGVEQALRPFLHLMNVALAGWSRPFKACGKRLQKIGGFSPCSPKTIWKKV